MIDLAALRRAVGDPPDFPNNLMPLAVGPSLTDAIYWSPLRFIEELLARGADPSLRTGIDDYETAFEIARAGATARPERKRELAAIVALLDNAQPRGHPAGRRHALQSGPP